MRAFAAALLLGAARLAAGGQTPDSLRCVLVVTADIDGASVKVNGIPAGLTPVVIDTLHPGLSEVSVRQPSSDSWFLAGTLDTVMLTAGDTTRVHALLQRRLQLLTEPAGIPVYAGDSLAGVTPLLLPGGEALARQVVTLRPPGASPVRVLPAGATGVLRLTLPLSGIGDDNRVVSVLNEERGIPLRLVISGGTALLSGVAAAAWKVRADGVYAEYRLNRDPATRERTRRLDTSAALALAAMQVSLGLFVYFLLSE